MSEAHNTKNYFAHGGNELVIGGKLTFLPGASVEGGDGLFDVPAASGTVTVLPAMPDSAATTTAALRQDFNNLLAALRSSGIMATEEASEGGDG